MIQVRPLRVFLTEDQIRFAQLSGDSNPIHMDALAARRTQAGQPAVHGVHILLWALEALAEPGPMRPRPRAIRANFTSFLLVGKTVELGEPTGDGNLRVTATSDGLPVMTMELRSTAPPAANVQALDDIGTISGGPLEPVVLDIDDINAQQRGGLAFASEYDAVVAAFPHACKWLGCERVSALLCCTRLVGMVCPGLHSIFNRVDVVLVDGVGWPSRLDYAVEKVDQRFRQVKLGVAGGGIAGSLTTSVRNPPVQQPSIASLASRVDARAFRGSVALVVGGSRGLGELTAKLLAAGGAEVIISYARGQSDAEEVAREIIEWGGHCRVIRYDVQENPTQQLGEDACSITHCYYYATSSIFAPSAKLFDPARFGEFCNVYVQAFSALCDALRTNSKRNIGIFYPSSISVSERPPGMGEYAMAKAAGEVLCDELNQRQKSLRIITSRLPRMSTDQTATLASTEAGSGFEVLLPLIGLVQAIGRET